MNVQRCLTRGLIGAAAVAGFWVLGSTAASAADAPTTETSDSILSGTQVLGDIDIPISLGGTAVSVLGDATSTGASTESAPASSSSGASSQSSDGIGSGTQVVPNVSIPIDLSGNAISVLGDASSTGASSGSAAPDANGGDVSSTSDDGVASGTQVAPTVSVPIDVTGTAVSVLGDAVSTDATSTSIGSGTSGSGEASTVSEDGIASGTQVLPVIGAPIDLTGTAVSGTGDAISTGATSEGATGTTGSGDATTVSEDGIGSGTQIVPVINLPIDLTGTAISVTGDAVSTDATTVPGDGTDPGTDPGDGTDPGTDPGDGTEPGTTPGEGTEPGTEPGVQVPGLPIDGDDNGAATGTGTASFPASTVTTAGVSLAATGAEGALVALLSGLALLLAGFVALRSSRRTA